MCTWRRPENLPITIQSLLCQKNVRAHLCIWNNNPEISTEIDSIVAQADLPISVIHSETNVGGFGRFYYARELADMYEYIVFIDDDQLLDENALAVLWHEARPKQISGWWAYKFITSWSY
jgi:GT2 family glycosyltransferase